VRTLIRVFPDDFIRDMSARLGGVNMNRRDYQKRFELAQRLRAVGVPLEINVDDEERPLRMRQISGEADSFAFVSKSGGTGYSVVMRLTVVRPNFAISSIDLETPWIDPSILLLEDPIHTGDAHGEYCFPGESLYKFHRSLVINHCADVTRMHSPGTTFEGLLLWAGGNPIPDDWPLWKKIPAFVVVYDQFSVPYRYPVTLCDTRDKKLLPREQKKSTRKPLFECRDPKPRPAAFKKHKVQDQEEETVRTK
jgi:hypothetical protein